MGTRRGFEFRIAEEDPHAAYLRLPGEPTVEHEVAKTVRLVDLMGRYNGAEVMLDFDQDGELIGIEIHA